MIRIRRIFKDAQSILRFFSSPAPCQQKCVECEHYGRNSATFAGETGTVIFGAGDAVLIEDAGIYSPSINFSARSAIGFVFLTVRGWQFQLYDFFVQLKSFPFNI